MDARHVDDPPEAPLVHPRQHGAGQQERRLQHQLQQEREAGRVEVLDRADVLHAGVVDEDVGVEADLCQCVPIGEIDRPGAPADLVGEHRGRCAVDVGDRHAGSRLREGPRAGGADAARPARDESTPALESRHPALAVAARAFMRAASASSIVWSDAPFVSRSESTAIAVTMQANTM